MQSLPKSLFIFLFCVPLAVIFGVMLATPLDRSTLLLMLGGVLLLLTPILLTSHHVLLIVSWNAYMNAFFLPGRPYIWMLAAAASCFFILLTRTLNRGRMASLHEMSITLPLLTIGLVAYVVAQFTGGIGSQALGSEVYGGKRYFFLFAAIFGYFAISNIPIPAERRQLMGGLFFLSSITAVASNIAYMLGENFYWLFLLFPVEWALPQAASDYVVGGFERIGGLAPASVALVAYMLIRYGVAGTFNIRYPWRMVVLVGAIVVGMFSGFRATLLQALLLFGLQFFAEGLHKTRHLLVLILSVTLVCAVVFPFANRLPLAVQRCLTLLPLDLDRTAIDAARGSTDWRLEMWRVVMPDVPKYLLVPKGFAIDPKDLYFSQQNISVRSSSPFEASLVAGDYHNGPLTLVIPFGIWGVLAFVWFCIASLRLLWHNYRYGEESIKNINTFMLVAFTAKLIYFNFIFGAYYLDLAYFTGIVGLSVSMNRGMARPAEAPALVHVPIRQRSLRPAPESPDPALPSPPSWQPAFRRSTIP